MGVIKKRGGRIQSVVFGTHTVKLACDDFEGKQSIQINGTGKVFLVGRLRFTVDEVAQFADIEKFKEKLEYRLRCSADLLIKLMATQPRAQRASRRVTQQANPPTP